MTDLSSKSLRIARGWAFVFCLAISTTGCELLAWAFVDNIDGHVSISFRPSAPAFAPGDTMWFTVDLVSEADEPMRLEFEDSYTCTWLAIVQDTINSHRIPEVWRLRPDRGVTCSPPDSRPIRLDPGDTVRLGRIAWDGTVHPGGSEDAVALDPGSYWAGASLAPHDVYKDGERFIAPNGVAPPLTRIEILESEQP